MRRRALLAITLTLAACEEMRTPGGGAGGRRTGGDASQPAPDATGAGDAGQLASDAGGLATDAGQLAPDGGRPGPDAGAFDATAAGRDATPNADAQPRDSGAGPTGDPFDVTSSVRRYAEAICARGPRCAPYTFAFYRQTQTRCVNDTILDTEHIWRAYGEARLAGHLSFVAAELEACIDGLRNGDCVTDPVAACGRIFQGNRQSLEGCAFQAECLPTLQCAGTGGCGTCQPRAQLNQSCIGGLCAPGLTCLQNSGSSFTCVPDDVAEGGRCGPRVGVCAGLLQCVQGRCTRPAGAGSTCDPTRANAADCEIAAGHYCSPQNMCVELQLVRVNGACGFPLVCDAEGICDMTSSTCTPRPTDGQPCTSRGTCAPDHFCEMPASICRALRSQGQPCSALGARECQRGLGCRGSPLSCQPLVYLSCPP